MARVIRALLWPWRWLAGLFTTWMDDLAPDRLVHGRGIEAEGENE